MIYTRQLVWRIHKAHLTRQFWLTGVLRHRHRRRFFRQRLRVLCRLYSRKVVYGQHASL